jgi:hypothetical protein
LAPAIKEPESLKGNAAPMRARCRCDKMMNSGKTAGDAWLELMPPVWMTRKVVWRAGLYPTPSISAKPI